MSLLLCDAAGNNHGTAMLTELPDHCNWVSGLCPAEGEETPSWAFSQPTLFWAASLGTWGLSLFFLSSLSNLLEVQLIFSTNGMDLFSFLYLFPAVLQSNLSWCSLPGTRAVTNSTATMRHVYKKQSAVIFIKMAFVFGESVYIKSLR